MSWGVAKGSDDIQNIPLLAIEVPGFQQDVHDGRAGELIGKELEQTTALGEPEDG